VPPQLARDLRAVVALTRDHVPARERLDSALGADLTGKLLARLGVHPRA
jgi:hypothetical protein